MTARAHNSTSAWLCLVAYLLAGVLGTQGFVLCIGPSGHVAIEIGAPGDCGGCLSAAVGVDGATPAELEQLPECPCDDIALPDAGAPAQKLDAKRWADTCLRILPGMPVAPVVFVSNSRAISSCDRIAAANRVSKQRSRSVVLLV